jgi:hypothetical protein
MARIANLVSAMRLHRALRNISWAASDLAKLHSESRLRQKNRKAALVRFDDAMATIGQAVDAGVATAITKAQEKPFYSQLAGWMADAEAVRRSFVRREIDSGLSRQLARVAERFERRSNRVWNIGRVQPANQQTDGQSRSEANTADSAQRTRPKKIKKKRAWNGTAQNCFNAWVASGRQDDLKPFVFSWSVGKKRNGKPIGRESLYKRFTENPERWKPFLPKDT